MACEVPLIDHQGERRPESSVELSIIVPVYNGEATLAEQLDALSRQQWDGQWEVVVVNNDSTDGTSAIIGRYVSDDPRFRTVDAPEQHNLSYVRNVGARAATGRSIAFCDADDVVADGWISAMGSALRHHEMVGSRFEYDRLSDVGAAGASRYAGDELPSMFGLPCVSGGGMGCHVSLWDRLGGNDESWDASGEDFAFSMKAAREFGVKPHFAEDAIIHIRLREDARSMFRQNRRFGRSHVRLFKEFGSSAHRPPIGKALRHTVALLLHLPDLRHPQRRVVWARAAGKRLGKIEGSLRYRTLYL